MKIHHLTETYDGILNSELQREIHRLRRHIKIYEETTGKETAEWKAHEILKYVMNWGFEESFPNLPITLRTFLTMCVCVAACKSHSSKLKLIETYLRSTMSHSRPSKIAILSIECEKAKSIDFETVTSLKTTMVHERYLTM